MLPKSNSLAVNWSHSSHFVTFRTKHQIKKFFYKWSPIWYAIKKVKVVLSFGLKAVILLLSKLILQNLLSLVCYLRMCHKK